MPNRKLSERRADRPVRDGAAAAGKTRVSRDKKLTAEQSDSLDALLDLNVSLDALRQAVVTAPAMTQLDLFGPNETDYALDLLNYYYLICYDRKAYPVLHELDQNP